MKTLVLCAALLSLPALAAPTFVQHTQTAYAAHSKSDWSAAREAYQQALAQGAPDPELWMQLAVVQAKLQDPAAAMASLARGAALGLRAVEDLDGEDFASLKSQANWQSVAGQVAANAARYRAAHANPDAARFVTSDIDLFWKLHANLDKLPDPAEAFERDYLAAGSLGLQDFVFRRIGSGKNLVATIRKYPRYYAAIRPYTESIAKIEPVVRASLRQFKELYADAEFPDMYFVVGAASSGGTSSSAGLIMGTEIFGRGPDVPVDELGSWLRAVTKSADLMPNIVVHELMHFQQRVEGKGLLHHAIKEGGADFLASLVSKGNFNETTYVYGYQNEAALKAAFAKDMATDAEQDWFGASSMKGERPSDLGYFMGFRICQAYYNKAADKKQAIRDILNTKDVKALLAASGYL